MVVIEETLGGWLVKEYRHDKEGGSPIVKEVFVARDTVETLQKLFAHMELGREYKYAYVVRLIVKHYRFNEVEGVSEEQMMTFFNGGRYRAKYYFPYYYNPLKVLERLGKIIYYGRGGVAVLNNEPL